MILSGKAKLAGILGWPVGHSKSPRLHGYWLDKHGIDGAYVPLPVAPENLADVVRALPRMGFRGGNVTVPHKEAVLALMDEVDPVARRIGAVNTIVVRGDGSLLGRNSDAFGFFNNLVQGCPAWVPTAGPAVVLGAGGASRAVVAALVDAGAPEVRLLNRTLARADEVVRAIGGPVRPLAWDALPLALEGANLLVNTTSLGMSGQPPLDIDLSPLPRTALVNDIVYAPLITGLLAQAQARGNPIVDGLGMLLHQGIVGFEAWFGVKPEVTAELREFVLAS